MINKLEKILVDKKTENIDVFLQIGSKLNEIIDSVNAWKSALLTTQATIAGISTSIDYNAKQTIAGLMDRVSKLEMMASSCYVKYPTNAEVNRALDSTINLMKSYDSKSLNLKNLDTKKEHALRLQLRDTKQQFKQLEDAHRKLKRDHDYLLVKHSRLTEENKCLRDAHKNLGGGK